MSLSKHTMTAVERRASMGLAGIYGLRMLGLFIILPVFALYAENLPGGDNHLLIGLGLGVYGLTQALLQIPAGWMADKIGRKPIIYAGLLLFAAGSFIAATADDIYWVIIGRAIQGAGAINAAVMALTADLTREQVRSKAMALIGITIGLAFTLSLIISPVLNNIIGVPGLFTLTGILAIIAILVTLLIIPHPQISRYHGDAMADKRLFGDVLRNKDLLRLDFGIFTVHAVLMSIFVQVPFLLTGNELPATDHWQVYLPVMLLAFLLMAPFFRMARQPGRLKGVFLSAIVLAIISQLCLLLMQDNLWGIIIALLIFFTGFNVLEAKLPSIVSVIAPLKARGTAMGVYSSIQFLGAFFGASVGGALAQYYGGNAVFIFSAALLTLWLLITLSMTPPADLRTRMYHLDDVPADCNPLQQQLSSQPGVHETLIISKENTICLKVDIELFDEPAIEQLIKKGH